ncbi:MAG: hypothetical protein H2038_12200 [Brevundimonas sp.]|jgi:hypothetical protein|uniref:hypothetical protein n=1 Tax=Brevundimonas sp. TaxID=1871086 RepID=UPI0017B311B0|nr:hypothetical protein [Brevundimonas sp.]MBA4805404.1 hypothetical protein [Brevundimonas sp.]
MTDRAIRNLAHLRRSASTARVLNLLRVAETHERDPEWRARPVFRTPALNRGLVIKHRLRRDELDLFHLRRHVATKVVVPIDTTDLSSGGRSILVDQRGFERSMREAFGLDSDHPDLATLRLMDALPSLDPFLLREQLRRNGVEPASFYFAVSDADLTRMVQFVEAEIRPLVTLSIGSDLEAVGSTRRFAGKILSNEAGGQLDALRDTLQLRPEDYEEGVFCWKGFLYYKWVLTSLRPQAAEVAAAVGVARPAGRCDRETRAELDRCRRILTDRIARTCAEAERTLEVYDEAYAGLTRRADPGAFRDFLLRAPRMFIRLGEQLGAVQHIISFWRFRFAPGAVPVGPEELMDIFMDFETGLADRDADHGQSQLAA